VFAEAAMHSIMHDIKANSGCQSAKNHAFQQGQPGYRGIKYQVGIDCHIGQHQHYGLQIKLKITGISFAGFMKIVVDSFLEFSVERMGVTRKFRKILFSIGKGSSLSPYSGKNYPPGLPNHSALKYW
jgi:hypothetical protein